MSDKTTRQAAAGVRSGRSKRASAEQRRVDSTADPIAASAEQYAAMMDARSKFVSVTFGLGWRLAITVLVPLFIGVQIDTRYHTSPSYTLAALFVAIGISAVVVWDTVKEVNASQAADDVLGSTDDDRRTARLAATKRTMTHGSSDSKVK